MTDMPEVAMDVKGLCERLVNEASDGWTGDAVCVDAALAAEAATALSTLSRELAEARAEIEFLRKRRGQLVIERDRARDEVSNAREILAGADFASLPADMPLAAIAEARMVDLEKARALAAEAASASKDGRIAALEKALAEVSAAITHEVNRHSIACTVWMPAGNETLVDFISRARSTKEPT